MNIFLPNGNRLMEFDTETNKVTNFKRSINDRVDYIYLIENDGKFVYCDQEIDVKSGDVIAVLYNNNNDYELRKIVKYGSFEHIFHMKEYKEICAKRDSEHKLKSETACQTDTCCKGS